MNAASNPTLTPPATAMPGAATHGAATRGDAPPRYRRRHYFIDPIMQTRYFLSMLFISAVVAFGVALLAAHYFLFVAGGGSGAAIANAPEIKARLLQMALWAAALMMLVLPVASVFLSHRIAGPAYRLRKAARDVAAGNYAFRIHLRTHDYLKPTAEAFNAMLTQLETQASADAQRNAAVRDAILLALKKLESPDELALPAALRLLEEAAAKLS